MSTLVHGARVLDGDDDGQPAWVHLDGHRILARGHGDGWRAVAAAGGVEVCDAASWVVPGFVDQHVHGGGGAAFEGDDTAIARALATHRAHGTVALVASLVSAPLDELAVQVARLARSRAEDPALLGVHLEGPFLAPSRRGAHAPSALVDPTPAAVEALLEAADGSIAQVTLAPERPGALDAVRRFVAAGVVVAVGHTEATYDEARAAFDAGAALLTHAYNAMPGIHHRAPGPLLAAIDAEHVVLEVIADGHHVAAPAVRLLFEAAPGRVALVTDAMSAAGSADGTYRLGGLDVTVRDGVALLDDDLTLAGSTLTMDAAVAWVVANGVDLPTAVAAATEVPARVLGRSDELGHLQSGSRGGALLLDADGRLLRILG